jgi:hypothetical protein
MKTKLPNFLCVGAQKAGTTTLHDILKQHPDIYLPKVKETKFFAHDDEYVKGIKYYKSKFFSTVKKEKAIGEIDPEYMYFDFVPERIYKTLGKDIKLIFMLRNPATRAFSHYQMSKRRGSENYTFEDAIEMEQYRLMEQSNRVEKIQKLYKFSYIDRGLYSKQIQRYLQFFPIENMFFIIFEDEFIINRKTTINNLLKFLNIKQDYNLDINLKSNSAYSSKYKFLSRLINEDNIIKHIGKSLMPSIIKDKIRTFLEEYNKSDIKEHLSSDFKKEIIDKYYAEDIKKLEKLINKDLSVWLK